MSFIRYLQLRSLATDNPVSTRVRAWQQERLVRFIKANSVPGMHPYLPSELINSMTAGFFRLSWHLLYGRAQCLSQRSYEMPVD